MTLIAFAFSVYHGLYKLLYYKPLALVTGNDKFRPPHLENRPTDFDET